MILQVSSKTKWQSCVIEMEKRDVDVYFEIGPTQLSAMNRKIGVKGATIALQNVKDLEEIDHATRK